ncbi:MAG TPA: NAD(P)H-dependent glycerol-3-phosphate dehydrogenase [Pyrinomonadaceae bacterium]|nr:NAD(P)H-dependent glycerol-3-phosphate dehydrogenase [Pyrinomonadaceae bacterium]
MKNITVIGAGNWGTALAVMAARKGHHVALWSRNAAVVDAINNTHENPFYIATVPIPEAVTASSDFRDALAGAEFVILAAPSHVTRDLLNEMLPALQSETILISATKGIEIETGKRISQVVDDVVGSRFRPRFVCLSGPSFANEVVVGHPTAIVAASADEEARRLVQAELSYENLRIYANDDVVGTELGGSAKNVMAIAAGMVSGLGFGTNSIAALITRGLAEMSRLAIQQGGRLETMMGLAGLGDLVLTCTGGLSRNRRVGYELGTGRSLEEITREMNGVAEGVKTTLAIHNLASKLGVELPITNQVKDVLYDGKKVSEAARELMSRPLRDEDVARASGP